MKNISDFFTLYAQAAWDKDIEKMTSLYAQNIEIFDMWDTAYQYGLETWALGISDWLNNLGSEKVRVTFDRVVVKENNTLAIAHAMVRYEAISVDNTVIRAMVNRITLSFEKTDDMWKVFHQHTSVPIDSDLTGILDF